MTTKEVKELLKELAREAKKEENGKYRSGINFAIGWIAASEFKDPLKVIDEIGKEGN